ncbi:hypothetical protein KVMX100_60129 [Klebsiella variicola]|nr:hypothetical protein KVMX100_60129 [Klebsiella variicola]
MRLFFRLGSMVSPKLPNDLYLTLLIDGTPMGPPRKAKGLAISRQPLLYLVAPVGFEPTTKRL